MPRSTEAGSLKPGPEGAAYFADIVSHALAEKAAGKGSLAGLLGLSGAELAALRDRWLPGTELPDLDAPRPEAAEDERAICILILMRAGANTPEARWLAAILSRRAQEPHHLWEDLGLSARPALRAMIERFLPGLAAANSANMRWKKFFYRQICSDRNFSLCLSPSCEECPERSECFAPD